MWASPLTTFKMKRDAAQRRKAAAKDWDTHGIDEADGEVASVEVATPLSAELSIRLDAAQYSNLKRLARERNLPITSMAKAILAEALDQG